MTLLSITKQTPSKPKQTPSKIDGKYLLEGTPYIVQSMRGNRISLEALDKHGRCFFGGCKVIRSVGFIRRHKMLKDKE